MMEELDRLDCDAFAYTLPFSPKVKLTLLPSTPYSWQQVVEPTGVQHSDMEKVIGEIL